MSFESPEFDSWGQAHSWEGTWPDAGVGHRFLDFFQSLFMQLEEVFSSRTSHTQDILLDFSLDKRQDETLLSLESGWGQTKLPGAGRYILVGPSPLRDQ